MWVSPPDFPSGFDQRLPSIRNPVPQSRINCVPSGAVSSRQGVFPPYRHVAGSTVGVEPRTPQKLSLAMGLLISVGVTSGPGSPAAVDPGESVPFLMVAVDTGSVNEFAGQCCHISQ